MTANRVEGLDVSVYQGYVNWGAVHEAGYGFAAVKATEGLAFTDPTFPHNWVSLSYRGMRRVAYHFLHCDQDGAAQADYLHRYVHDHGRFTQGDAVACDFEISNGQTPFTCLEVARDFVLRAREQIGKQVIFYTFPYFWKTQMGNPKDEVLSSCPLWLASYSAMLPTLDNWPVVSFWQYSDAGTVPGVSGQVDLDAFLGTSDQLAKVLAFPPK